jgi:hypothetical protein
VKAVVRLAVIMAVVVVLVGASMFVAAGPEWSVAVGGRLV